MAKVAIEKVRIDRALARRLPNVDGKEFDGLVEDIKRRGILVELLVTADGLLLDGHRRLAAAKKVGLSGVPVKRLRVNGAKSWKKAVAVAVNLYRRHLNEAQRADLGSTLLRIERGAAKERQRAGQARGRANRGKVVVGGRHPQQKERDRATQRAAAAVGVSRQTFERVQAVKKSDPAAAQRMLGGRISITAAYRKVKVAEIRARSRAEVSSAPRAGLVKNLREVYGKYRCLYLDPPWDFRDSRSRGAAARHYPTLSLARLKKLSVGKLCHREGAHVFLWAPWAKIREAAPHELLNAWGLVWVGEFLWDKGSLGVGRWFRGRTEVLICAVSGNLPLLSDCIDPLVSVPRGRHSAKPEEFARLIEEHSPAPRIELFARRGREGWDRWGYEA